MQALQPLSCPAVIFRKLMFVKCKTDLSGEIFHNLKDKASLFDINQCKIKTFDTFLHISFWVKNYQIQQLKPTSLEVW